MKQYFIICILLSLFGCAAQQVSPVGSNIQKHYSFPKDYSEHRSQQQFYQTQNGKIAYTDHGNGNTLVLIHGVPTSSWLYRKIIPNLQQHMRVISVDLLGYGSSDKPKSSVDAYSPHMQAAYIQNLLNDLDIQEYAIMVHDMGGLVGWELLKNDHNSKSRINKLIIQNTIVSKKGFHHPNIPPGMIARQITQAYSNKLTSSAILEASFNSLGLGGDYSLSESECFGYVKPMTEGSSEALYAFFSNINNDLYTKLESNKTIFNAFNGETLVLWGGLDEILTTEQIPFLQENLNIPARNIHIYPNHKHFLVEEMPDEVISQVNTFMQK